MALVLWGPQLAGKHLLFHYNNASVVHIMARASSCSKSMMALVHTLTLLAIRYNVHIKVQHIAGLHNEVADALSRFNMDRFWWLCPDAAPESLAPVTIW